MCLPELKTRQSCKWDITITTVMPGYAVLAADTSTSAVVLLRIVRSGGAPGTPSGIPAMRPGSGMGHTPKGSLMTQRGAATPGQSRDDPVKYKLSKIFAQIGDKQHMQEVGLLELLIGGTNIWLCMLGSLTCHMFVHIRPLVGAT